MNFFIQLDQQNSNIVRYFAIGEHDSENKFTGIVYGYEGGGVYSDAFIYKSKNLPSYFEDEPIEWDELEEVFNKISKYKFDELDSKAREFMDFDTNALQWIVLEKSKHLFENMVYSTMEINPPSYGLTSWEDTPKEEWEFNDFKNEITKHLKDSLVEYCEDHIKHFNAFPVDFVVFEDSFFEIKVLFEDYEALIGKETFDRLALGMYKFYWIDPAFYNNEEHSSDFCEVTEWPVEQLQLKCYSKLSHEDYEHCQDEGNFGLEIGLFSMDGVCEESIENTWFRTEYERDEYIKQKNVSYDAEKISEYIKNEDVFKNLQNYSKDTIFYIQTRHSEAEVTRDELLVRYKDCFAAYNDKKVIVCPINQTNGSLELDELDSYFIKEEDVCVNDLQKTIDYIKVQEFVCAEFDFCGDNEYGIEAFYATISSFKVDNDYSIVATIRDLEDNHFDVSWEKIKDSDFKLFDL